MRASAPTGMPKAIAPVVGADALIRPPVQPPRPPGQRVAERNARKEEQVKCVLAARCRRHPRRGNPLSNPHRTPPRPLGGSRKPAGTISRRPSYLSKLARMCKFAPNIFSFPPGAAHFLFDVSKRKWGAHPAWTMPPAGADAPEAAVRRPISLRADPSVRPYSICRGTETKKRRPFGRRLRKRQKRIGCDYLCCSRILAKHSLQYTGRSDFGSKGTRASPPQAAQTAVKYSGDRGPRSCGRHGRPCTAGARSGSRARHKTPAHRR